MTAPDDFHVQFDAINAFKYHRRITTSIATVVVVVLAIVAFECTGGGVAFAGLTSDSINGFDTTASPGAAHVILFALLPIIVLSAVVLVLLLAVVPSLLRKTLDAQRCTITATSILCESGWLNRTTQVIPLDRIQDLSVKQGFLQHRFGLYTIEIQTAGSPSPFPEAVLHAPKDAHKVREEIMRRRDALLLLGKAHASLPTDDHSIDDAVVIPSASAFAAGDHQLPQIADALVELNNTMLRIEKLLSKDVVVTNEQI